MNICSVVGNGQSREGFNISKLRDVGPVYGCNNIYQDFHIDILVACDLPVSKQVVASGYNSKTNFYTRNVCFGIMNQPQNVLCLPDLIKEGNNKWEKSQHWGSGLFATYLACLSKADIVLLLGFDLNGYNEKENNNVYKDLLIPGKDVQRKNKPVDASFWIKQFELLFQWFPQTTFAFINHDDWQYPESWNNYNNWTIDNYEILDDFMRDNKL